MSQSVAENLAKSLSLIQASNFKDALLLLRKIIGEESNNIDALALMAQVLLKEKEYQEGASILEKLIEVNQKNLLDSGALPGVQTKLALCYQNSGDYEKAITTYINYLFNEPFDLRINLEIAKCHFKLKNDASASDYLEKAKKECEDSVEFHILSAFLAKEFGAENKLKKHIEALASLEPGLKNQLQNIIFNSFKDDKPKEVYATVKKYSKNISNDFLSSIKFLIRD